jgi:hypothetical protein
MITCEKESRAKKQLGVVGKSSSFMAEMKAGKRAARVEGELRLCLCNTQYVRERE